MRYMKVVPDTSVIINATLSKLIESGELKDVELIIPAAVVDELQAQASKNRETGFIGLSELKRIREFAEANSVRIRFYGERPSLEDIRLARGGRIDAIIRDAAKKESATLYTSDYVQALVAEAEGIAVKHFPPAELPKTMSFEEFFTPDTLSLHLKEGAPIYAKRGAPGSFELIRLTENPLTAEEVSAFIKEITEHARVAQEGGVEIMRSGAFVAQLGPYRIAVAKPPFSDGLEVTVVRPVVKLRLEDYRLSKKLMDRLKERAEGILIAGPPGSGKTTFAGSLAEFYNYLGKIVKTLESPRDLQVSAEITQYGPLEGDFEKTAEILLLVRPDYTVFDEIRKDKDFRIFADMRLAGVGMIGVVHASDPVDAIQRFIGRIELGMIPHIIDTIVFLRGGEVKKVYVLRLAVRVPSGMTEADLARPIVEVRNFENSELEYEIYTFGEENVIMPVAEMASELESVKAEVSKKVLDAVRGFDPNAQVEVLTANKVVVRVDREVVPHIIGKKGEKIRSLQDQLGLHIDVEPMGLSLGPELKYESYERGNSITFIVPEEYSGERVNLYVADEYLFSAMVGKRGVIKVSKRSEQGRKIVGAISRGMPVRVFLTG